MKKQEDDRLLNHHANIFVIVLSFVTVVSAIRGQTKLALASFVCSLIAFVVARKTDRKK